MLFQGQYRERELDINFHIAPSSSNQQKVQVIGSSTITESLERREINQNRKDKREDPIYEEVTIIKRLVEHRLVAERVYISI